jgi:hypothetical protein
MSRKAPLTDVEIRNAKSQEGKSRKLSDGGGLFLQVQPNGSKLWRYTYRFNGKQKLLALGSYPETTLAEARTKHAAAHKQVSNGIDPSEAKKEDKRMALLNAENSFESVAREWHDKKCNILHPARITLRSGWRP